MTPDTPRNCERSPPSIGRPPAPTTARNTPQGMHTNWPTGQWGYPHGSWAADPDLPLPGRAAGRGCAPQPGRPARRRPARGRPPASPTARDAGSQEHALWGRCLVPTRAPPTHQRRIAAGSGGTPVTRCLSQWGMIPPPPGGNHPRNTHHGAQTWATRPGCQPHKRATGGGRAPDARRPSRQREHLVLAGTPLDLRPPCAYARHPWRPGEQCSAPACRSVRCGANVRLSHRHPHPQHQPQISAATGTGKPQEVRTPSPALRHSDTAMAEPKAPRNTHPRSPALDAAHEVIRALGLGSRGGDPTLGRHGHGLRPGADLRGPRRRRARAAHAASGRRASPLPRVEAGALNRRRPSSLGNTPGPQPTTGHCPQWGSRPHTPPCATVWRRAGSGMGPSTAA